MADDQDRATAGEASPNSSANTVTAAFRDAPLPVETPALASALEPPTGTARVEAGPMGPFQPVSAGSRPASASGAPTGTRRRWRRLAPLAAAVAVAAVLGAIAGAGAAAGLLRGDAWFSGGEARASAASAMQESVARLEGELASLKSGIAAAERSAGAQFGKLAERLARAEKAQAAPAAKLAKIAESIDRMERQFASASGDVTGSVAAKEPPKPQLAEDWQVRDYYAGRALVESPAGRLFDIGRGSNLPELGRVESIKREQGRIVVLAKNGIISSVPRPLPPPRRRALSLPFRF